MIVHERFQGMFLRPSEYLLGPRAAVFSENMDHRTGALNPLPINRFIRTIDQPGLVPLGNNEFATTAEHTPAITLRNRVMFIEDDRLVYVNEDDDATFNFGLPSLFRLTTGTDRLFTATYTGATAVPADPTIFYALAAVNRHGDETDLSVPVEIGPVSLTGQVTLTILRARLDELTTLLEDDGLQLRFYRSLTGAYLKLGDDLDIPDTGNLVFVDVLDTTLTSASKLWESERTALTDEDGDELDILGVVEHPNGFLACHTADEVLLSDIQNPSLFPVSYRFDFNQEIIGLAEFYGRIIVFLRDAEHRTINLVSPDNLQIDHPETSYKCLSGASIAKIQALGVLYASRDGIVITDGYQSQLFTVAHFDERSWAPFNPENCRIVAGDDDFLLLSPTMGVYLFQPGMNGSSYEMTRLSEQISDVHSADGKFYISREIAENSYVLEELFGGGDLRVACWRSGRVALGRPATLTSMQVLGDYDNEVVRQVGGLGVTPLGAQTKGLGATDLSLRRVSRQRMATLKIILGEGNNAYTYDVPYPFITSRASNIRGAFQRQNKVYQLEIKTNAEVQQLVFTTRERMQDAVGGPGQGIQ